MGRKGRQTEGQSVLQPCWADGKEEGGEKKRNVRWVVVGVENGTGMWLSVITSWLEEDEDED